MATMMENAGRLFQTPEAQLSTADRQKRQQLRDQGLFDDEGVLTDNKGEKIDFRNSVIIMTTNLGNDKTVQDLSLASTGFTAVSDPSKASKKTPSRQTVEKNTHEAIKKYFKPELLNRIDKIIVFNHLQRVDLEKIAELEMGIVVEKLSKKGLSVEYSPTVLDKLIELGVDSVKGARGMSQMRRDVIETFLSKEIVYNQIPRGTMFHIDYRDDDFVFEIEKPEGKK
jgi:ATP-dependent Clp protease ATP-binding subunit ClpC